MPMPARAFPCSLKAIPVLNPISSKRTVLQVAVQLVRLRVIRNDEIRPSVAVVIDHCDTERFRTRVEDAALVGNIVERSISAITEKPGSGPPVGLGCAVGFAFPIQTAKDIMLGRPPDVVADEQIEQTVAIEIEPHRRRAECGPVAQPGLTRHIDEGAFSIVLKKPVLADTGNKHILMPVVVVVSDSNTHPVHTHRESGGFSDVSKRAVPIVLIQFQRGSLKRPSGPVRAVKDQNVEPAIAVVIEKRATRPHSLREVLGAKRPGVVMEINARGLRDVYEMEAGILLAICRRSAG